ncbi:MAG: sulfatase-like hydrolase/transferase [Phycisphaerales bacterium]|nr:sulfatase-like hydrolase/transferase [Phycisphaerales bacterium]
MVVKRKPHIVIFNPDQFRADCLGHMGCAAAKTPVMDRLAREEAVSFRWAFCQNTVCTPSRCSFMTGWYPHVRGHRTMFHMLHSEAGETNLLKVLKENGYHVWWGGKNDLVPGQNGYGEHCDVKFEPDIRYANPHSTDAWRGEKGSDTWFSFLQGKLEKTAGEEIYQDEDWSNVLGAIEQIKNAPADKPLCIYLPLGYPHPPYAVEEPYFSVIDRAKIARRIPSPDWTDKPSLLKGIAQRQGLQGWSEERWAELKAVYLGMCSRIDDQLGRIIAALKDAGIYDDTAIFTFADHGDFTGDYGLVEKTQNTFEDVLTRVPFVIKPPKGVAVKPRISEAMVELVDFSATVYDLLGIDPGYTYFGRSLLPVVAGEGGGRDEHRDAVFCEGGRLMEEQHTRERESKGGTDPDNLYWPRISLQVADGPEHGKGVMCRTKEWKYVKRLFEKDELYDLRNDPSELRNVIDDPSRSGVREMMRERLLRFMIETADVAPLAIDRRW